MYGYRISIGIHACNIFAVFEYMNGDYFIVGVYDPILAGSRLLIFIKLQKKVVLRGRRG